MAAAGSAAKAWWPRCPSPNALMLPPEGAIAGLGDGLRRGFTGSRSSAIRTNQQTDWSIGWLSDRRTRNESGTGDYLLVLAPPQLRSCPVAGAGTPAAGVAPAGAFRCSNSPAGQAQIGFGL